MNYFQILGVEERASAKEIKQAYLRKARQYHPDLNPDTDHKHFTRIRKAYEVLSDSEKRSAYYKSIQPPQTFFDLMNSPDGKNFFETQTKRAPKEPQRGEDILLHVYVTEDIWENGGILQTEIKLDGISEKRSLKIQLPPNTQDQEWYCVKGLGGIGKNGGHMGDLWLFMEID